MSAKVHITIIGLGRIGTALGRALKQAASDQVYIVGHDKDPERARVAVREKAIDRGEWNLPRSVEGADLVILALPLSAIKETLAYIAEDLRPNAVVTDTAPLMVPPLRWAQDTLPQEVHFIPGHPIVRDVLPSSEVPSPDIFRDEFYCLGTTASAHPKAVKLLTDMLNLIGARPFFLQPEEHDALMAGVEQTPRVLALALLHAVTQSPGWRDMRKLAGVQFEAATYTTYADAEGLVAELLSNREHVLSWLESMEKHLAHWRGLLEAGDEERLHEHVRVLLDAREQWLKAALAREWEEKGPQEKGFSFRHWLFGETFSRRWRERREK